MGGYIMIIDIDYVAMNKLAKRARKMEFKPFVCSNIEYRHVAMIQQGYNSLKEFWIKCKNELDFIPCGK